MKITDPRPISPPRTRPNRVSRGAKGSDFASQVPSDEASTSRLQASSSIGAVEGLFALQEVPDATDGRSRGIAYGDDLLDRLDEIRFALLSGAIPRDRLAELSRRVQAERGAVDDSRLAAILDEIDLRAAVELAKLGMLP